MNLRWARRRRYHGWCGVGCDTRVGIHFEALVVGPYSPHGNRNHAMETRRTRPTIPPTTPPIIAGVFLVLPPWLLLVLAVAEDDVLEGDGREVSKPPTLSARVTLNESEIYQCILAIIFTIPNSKYNTETF